MKKVLSGYVGYSKSLDRLSKPAVIKLSITKVENFIILVRDFFTNYICLKYLLISRGKKIFVFIGGIMFEGEVGGKNINQLALMQGLAVPNPFTKQLPFVMHHQGMDNFRW